MTTNQSTSDKKLTLLEDSRLNEPGFNVEHAGIKLTNQAASLLEKALNSTDMDLDQIAEALEVSTNEVLDLVSAEGNMTFDQFGRIMRALGYVIQLTPYIEEINAQGKSLLYPVDYSFERKSLPKNEQTEVGRLVEAALELLSFIPTGKWGRKADFLNNLSQKAGVDIGTAEGIYMLLLTTRQIRFVEGKGVRAYRKRRYLLSTKKSTEN